MTSPTSKRTTRLLARFAASGALALSLAGGLTAAAASAAPAPTDDGRYEVVPPVGEVVIVDPGPTIPEPPGPGKTGPGPLKPCKDLPDNIHVPKECRPDPCKDKAAEEGYKVPDRCRPDPCKDKGEKGEKPEKGEKAAAAQGDSPELSPHPEPKKCPPPPEKKCQDPDGCDRPVPGKPTFTG